MALIGSKSIVWKGFTHFYSRIIFKKEKNDTTLFIQRSGSYILVVQIYFDGIIIGSSNLSLCENFANLMKGEFEMSLMGELTFFLGLQIKESTNETFISQSKYT